jgi:hypothetical protein
MVDVVLLSRCLFGLVWFGLVSLWFIHFIKEKKRGVNFSDSVKLQLLFQSPFCRNIWGKQWGVYVGLQREAEVYRSLSQDYGIGSTVCSLKYRQHCSKVGPVLGPVLAQGSHGSSVSPEIGFGPQKWVYYCCY